MLILDTWNGLGISISFYRYLCRWATVIQANCYTTRWKNSSERFWFWLRWSRRTFLFLSHWIQPRTLDKGIQLWGLWKVSRSPSKQPDPEFPGVLLLGLGSKATWILKQPRGAERNSPKRGPCFWPWGMERSSLSVFPSSPSPAHRGQLPEQVAAVYAATYGLSQGHLSELGAMVWRFGGTITLFFSLCQPRADPWRMG